MQLDIHLDNTGFPMIWIKELNAYLHWMPVTKIQVEYFLSATTDTTFDESWYYRMTSLNARVSPRQVSSQNLWQAFTTGILPREAQRYAVWTGRSYDLPTAQEWQTAYRTLKQVPASRDHITQIIDSDGVKERTKVLLENLARTMNVNGRSLADQMLMCQAIMEYVYETSERNTFVGLNEPHPGLAGSLRNCDDPELLTNPTEGTRMKHYGFRLIHRGAM